MSDARKREREALEAALREVEEGREDAILAYGRAVRQADKEAALGTYVSPLPGQGIEEAEYHCARKDAAAAIEALERDDE